MKRRDLLTVAVTALCTALMVQWGPWRHAHAEASESSASTTKVAPNQIRYSEGSAQLAYLDIKPVSRQRPPLTEPVPARLTFDEDHTARIYSPLTGRTAQIVVEPGHRVKAGDVLAWIDAPDYDTAVADLRKAQADHEVKQSALTRAQKLFDAGALSQRDLEAAQLDARTAKAEIERASARLHGLDSTGRDGRFALRSPIAGLVAERHLNPGQVVQPDLSIPLFVITDPTHLDVVADVPETQVSAFHVGQGVRIDGDDPALQNLSATVTTVGVVLDPDSRRIPVRAHLQAPPTQARPEMFVRVSPVGAGDEAVVVPNSAIVTSGLQSYVFVEREPGLLEKTPVSFAYRGREVSYLSKGITP
ncbi:MAG TPA: efflux RND transporter periplasmic adaptor subunit, partial [Aquabacterium sp.]|nr:efflux RND transporter periplasmic adaptor subunit [Aquabacterium sp.]